jgi:hypothetical protein
MVLEVMILSIQQLAIPVKQDTKKPAVPVAPAVALSMSVKEVYQ